MKLLLLTFYVILLSSLFCKAQNYNIYVADSIVYGFLTDIVNSTQASKNKPFIPQKQISKSIIGWDTVGFNKDKSIFIYDTLNCIGKYLTAEDGHHIFKQILSVQGKQQWKNKFDTIRFFEESYKQDLCLYKFSIPLFSIDEKYALVRTIIGVNGTARGGYYLYHKESTNKWKQICAILSWVK